MISRHRSAAWRSFRTRCLRTPADAGDARNRPLTGCSRRSSRPSRMRGQIRHRPLSTTASWSTLVGNSGTGGAADSPSGGAAYHHAHNGFGESAGRLDPVPGRAISMCRPSRGQAAARSVPGNLLRPPAVHLGFRGIAQPQLDAAADLILQRRSDLRPARRRQHHVHPERNP